MDYSGRRKRPRETAFELVSIFILLNFGIEYLKHFQTSKYLSLSRISNREDGH